ncbi:MAG: super-infection exclusion protein B [Sweet potato little leaf phytoplasma]|uniref:Superinfection exclusion B family protein n=4 Tax=Candidatus Phytoplasma TaxID=33926 RepID=A0AAP4X8E1_9MOLU|nr:MULTISPECIES: super-infection exclusion protein B [Phytoplasma]QLL36939.1 hypothetical protein EPWB_v2c3470 ['Echinacea purpurea' witches'-broom phytoplasma]WEX20345.1 MAG: super-infection exclusion protein B [Candidatus Phytoplasma aurantifolia]EMR14730.1 putative effector [Peanut witches'-broom phytoplasma NTU2011]MDO7987288.1 superinfection exclusion B family protein [Sweet potato little leaf phytoplasma]MDO8005527.1 superinfection exclusion B family protein [Sweet potato little leaf phy
MKYYILVVIIFVIAITFIIMNLIYRFNFNYKIERYLLNCDLLEQEVLKTFIKNKNQTFPLTNQSPITQKFLNLNILTKIKNDDVNPAHGIYLLNANIFDLVIKNNKLKKIYLEN